MSQFTHHRFTRAYSSKRMLAALFLFYCVQGTYAALQDHCVSYTNTSSSVKLECYPNSILWSIDPKCSRSSNPDPCKDSNHTVPCTGASSLDLLSFQGCLGQPSCSVPMPPIGTLTMVVRYTCFVTPSDTLELYVVPDEKPDGNCSVASPCVMDTAFIKVWRDRDVRRRGGMERIAGEARRGEQRQRLEVEGRGRG